ncbi:histidine kinase [Flavobacterium sp. WG21]|uniref:sensor histidine kinase n=1 Tax=Flavobacterium sp. WG21 TaxID=1229487 RepID=UPI00034C6C62|nr:histidine kinase [Flavobacterium sp. WG21]
MKQFLLFLILLLSKSVQAQFRNQFVIMDSRNGLKSDYVYSVREGLQHNIWIATNNGLTRFNGNTFRNFSIENGLSSNDIVYTGIDSQNRVWLCDYHYGLHFVKGYKVFYVKAAKKIPSLSFCFERKGSVYFSSISNGECYLLTPGNYFLKYKPKKKDLEIHRYDIASKTYYGYDHFFKRHFVMEGGKKYRLKPFYKVTVNNIDLHRFGLYTRSGKIDSVNQKPLYNFYYNKMDFVIDNLKQIVPFYTPKDSLKFHSTTGNTYQNFKNIGDLIKLNGLDFKSVFIDSGKNFWFIDEKNRLYFVKYSSLEILNKVNYRLFGSNDTFIRKSLLEGDKLYFIANSGLFGVMDVTTFEIKIIRKFDEKLYNLFKFGDKICLISNKGKYLYDKTVNDFSFDVIHAKLNLNKTFMDSNNNLFAIDENYIESEYNDKITFDFTDIRLKEFCLNNNLAVVGNEEMVASYNFITKEKRKKTSIKNTSFIRKMKDGVIIGTGNRMVFFLDNKLNVQQRIKLKDNCYFIKYHDDKVYFVTYNDITIYKKKEGKWHFFNKINFNEGVLRGRVMDIVFLKHNIMIISDNGVSVIKNSYIDKSAFGEVQIVDFFVGEKSILNSKEKIIKQGKGNIMIRTSLRTFDNPDCFEIFYRLVKNGNYENTSWNQLSSRNIVFSDLAHGNYIFEVCARNLRDTNQKTFEKVSFKVEPYFWETNFFFIAVLSLYLLMFYFFLRYFRKKINEKNKLKLELITLELKSLKNQMKPHFLFNALNNLQGILFTRGVEDANFFLNKFSKLLRSTLEITRDKITSLDEEIKYIKTYLDFEQVRSNNELHVTYKIDETLDLKRIEIPVMVVQTIVENAIIHGLNPSKKRKELLIEIYPKNDSLCIIIEDNGIGRCKTNNSKGHKSLASLIIADRFRILTKLRKKRHILEVIDLIKDGLPVGTRVEITVPLYYFEYDGSTD